MVRDKRTAMSQRKRIAALAAPETPAAERPVDRPCMAAGDLMAVSGLRP
jgi:hypothetical protein